ncbi:MAG: hypothetical protein ACTH7R_10045 [Corynebacterium flavescens]
MGTLSSLSSNAADLFAAIYHIVTPFVDIASGLSDLLGLIA